MRLRASALKPVDRTVPGDPSASAFFVVAGCVVPDSAVEVADVYSGPARLGYVGVLRAHGGRRHPRPRAPGHVDHPGHVPARCGPPRCAPARSPPSTRSPPSPWPRRSPRAPRSSPTSASSGSRRSTAWWRWRPWSRPSARRARDRRRHPGGHRPRRPAPRCPLRQPRRPPHGHGRRRRGPGGPPGRAQPHHRVRRGGDQLPGLRRGPATRLTGGDRAPRPLLVAIDGPAGAGKSTVSTAVAEHLGVDRLDTGADVPCRGRPGPGRRHTARRRRGGGGAGGGVDHRGGGAGHHRRPRRDRRDPLARGGTGRLDRCRQP